MALTVVFASGATRSQVVGPLPGICLERDVLRDTPGGNTIARHRDHAWELPSGRYSRLDCDGRLAVHFERLDRRDQSQIFGPYQHFSFVDGMAYVNGRIFAFLDTEETGWFCYEDGQTWDVMHVSPT